MSSKTKPSWKKSGSADRRMVIPDVNLLLYAHVSAFRQHPESKKWWEGLLSGREEIGIASPALFGFIRLATNRRVLDPPMDVEGALERAESWFTRTQVRFLQPGPRHLEIAFRLLRALGA